LKEAMRDEGRIEEYRNIMGHSGACSSNDSKVIQEEEHEESFPTFNVTAKESDINLKEPPAPVKESKQKSNRRKISI
jgi:hypothetical protein